MLTGCNKCGSDKAVNGETRGIGQNVLQYSFQTGSSNTLSYFHIFFLIVFVEETFIRNVI